MTLAEIIAEVRRLDREATPGPWELDPMAEFVLADGGQMNVLEVRGWGYLKRTLDNTNADAVQRANGELAAFARTALPRLLAVAEAAMEMVNAENDFHAFYGFTGADTKRVLERRLAAFAVLDAAARGEGK